MKNSGGIETVGEWKRFGTRCGPCHGQMFLLSARGKCIGANVRWTDVPAESVRENRECERGGQGDAHTASGRGNNNVSRILAKRDRKSHAAIMDLLQTQAHTPSTSSDSQH